MRQVAKARSHEVRTIDLLDASQPSPNVARKRSSGRNIRARQIAAVAILGGATAFWALLIWRALS